MAPFFWERDSYLFGDGGFGFSSAGKRVTFWVDAQVFLMQVF